MATLIIYEDMDANEDESEADMETDENDENLRAVIGSHSRWSLAMSD